MKTVIRQIACWTLLLAGVSCARQPKTELTEQNYLREDSILWAQYDADIMELSEQQSSGAIDQETARANWKEIYENASQKNVELALKYATVPSGLRRVYMLRSKIAKETLEEKLATLPDSLKESKYAQYVRRYIDTRQLTAGDPYLPFACQTPEGEAFDWGTLKGKHFLLLYDGLVCMGENGRNYLNELLDNNDNDRFGIVVYLKCSNAEEMAQYRKLFPRLILISDFQPEGNPMTIAYNCQATPTCFMIDDEGRIRIVSEGLDPTQFDAYLQDNGCHKK